MALHGPRWLGIGAQRCGTTWFTDLLTQHPLVDVPDGVKELNELYRYGLLRDWDKEAERAYKELFKDRQIRLGEFTPFYMRSMWVCEHARRLTPEDAPIIVMVRDPLDRFASGLRHMMAHAIRRHIKRKKEQDRPKKRLENLPPTPPTLSDERKKLAFLDRVAAAAAPRYVLGPPGGKGMHDRTWMRYVGSDVTWAGMYGAQLLAWRAAFPEERFVFIQYEKMRSDPQYYVDLVWKRLGVDPVPLKGVGKRSRSSTQSERWALEDHPELTRTLRALYRPDAELLARDWDVDLSLWKRLMADD